MCNTCIPKSDLEKLYSKPGKFIAVAGDPSKMSEEQLTDTVNVTGTPYVSKLPLVDRPQGLVNGASGDRDLEETVAAVFVRAFRLWQQRQRKYGRGNIARHGALGCLIRDTDKTARLEEYYLRGKKDNMDDETVTDSWMDKINYAVMGLVCFEGKWPGCPEETK